ncbi:MAG: carboxypeptidase-like regulatory domain-containing protein [Candidatus Aminicenantales bacterium]
MRLRVFVPVLIILLSWTTVQNPRQETLDFLDEFIIKTPGRFNGYTNYWHSIFWEWQQYGNLFQLSVPDVVRAIAQSKLDTAEELGIPGLLLQEGFLAVWLKRSARELNDPTQDEVEKALSESDLLVYICPASELGKRLGQKFPEERDWRRTLQSHQLNAAYFRDIRAFCLEKGDRKLFVVLADYAEDRDRFRTLIEGVRNVLDKYDLHRGWFGTGTLLHSVTCQPGHPLEVIARGLEQGNDWFTFSGYMDYLLQAQLPEWLGKVGLKVVTDVGTGKATHSFGSVAYGCKSWDGFKIQDMPTEEEWIRFVKERDGHIFRPVYNADCDPFEYDGYIAIEGNKKQIDTEVRPFILQTGYIREDAPPAMALFSARGRDWNREAMWDAILGRREVGILPQGKMLGPEIYRNALQMLLLDRVWLEGFFGDAVQMRARIDGRSLQVSLANVRETEISGNLMITAAPELVLMGEPSLQMNIPPRSSREVSFQLQPRLEATGRTNPILVTFDWEGRQKRTLAVMDLPPAISLHRLLYGQSPEVVFPVSVHNFGDQDSFPVRVQVYAAASPDRVVFDKSERCDVPPSGFKEMTFRLPLQPGTYTVKVSALGAETESQLGVEALSGRATCTPVDLNGDGVSEYRMENSRVEVTLLATGARIIEYIVRERGDNVLFKLWPEKESTDKRPFRERGFYPYGGFEDFLGQASIETHTVYSAEVVRGDGPFVQIRMAADYYGNRLEKIFTLYGDSPLVEVRFALTFRNPELNMLGPQPILALGEKHWTEDVFIVPTVSGRREFRMRPEEYFGEVLFLKEGWNAGRDTAEDVCFVGAFPVSEPEFLHMWMNHPSNGESHHYYAEFQPWVPIFQKTVRYFSYYLWGAAGPWEAALAELRRRNLITAR